MLKNESFYAIVGTNGYGLVKSWSKCARCMKYFKQARYKNLKTQKKRIIGLIRNIILD